MQWNNFAACALLLSLNVGADSFDCAGAATQVEKAICAQRELLELEP